MTPPGARVTVTRGEPTGVDPPVAMPPEDTVVLLAPTDSRLTTPLSPAHLLGITRELADQCDRWLDLVEHHALERWFERVAVTDDFDVWLIGWDAFQGVDLHDHGRAAGVLYVVEGELFETSTTRSSGGLVQQTLRAGAARAFGADHVHGVVNPAARPATSLHVYSPPLTAMEFYRPGHGRALEPTHTELALAPRSGPGELR
jgi:hypothetical protein